MTHDDGEITLRLDTENGPVPVLVVVHQDRAYIELISCEGTLEPIALIQRRGSE
jgi:hypothetical protein